MICMMLTLRLDQGLTVATVEHGCSIFPLLIKFTSNNLRLQILFVSRVALRHPGLNWGMAIVDAISDISNRSDQIRRHFSEFRPQDAEIEITV